MSSNKKFNDRKEEFINCTKKIKKKCCCINAERYCEIKKLAKCMICTGVLAILILCFPPVVWFVLLAVGMIVLGIMIFRL
ncbi:MAG: hypothetical protein IKL72_03375 [Firmicutes bacterium]|nr:hypothetical protein [Bacillota bacterium]